MRPEPAGSDQRPASERLFTSVSRPPSRRPILKLAVVRGGVYSREEAVVAGNVDSVVAGHYRDVDVQTLRPVVLNRAVMRYVSFRQRNRIYWTRTRVRIPAGELVLANGDARIRARCGNRIADTPQLPTLPVTDYQPTDDDLETEAAIGTADWDPTADPDQPVVQFVPASALLPSGIAFPTEPLAFASPGNANGTSGAEGGALGFGSSGSGIAAPSPRPAGPGSPGVPPQVASELILPQPPLIPTVLPEPLPSTVVLIPAGFIIYVPAVVTGPTSQTGIAGSIVYQPPRTGSTGTSSASPPSTSRPGGGSAGSLVFPPAEQTTFAPPQGGGDGTGSQPNSPLPDHTAIPEPATAFAAGIALAAFTVLAHRSRR